jgi:hypothetical protein
MHASRFSFAFSYRYSFTGSGEADGVLTMVKKASNHKRSASRDPNKGRGFCF